MKTSILALLAAFVVACGPPEPTEPPVQSCPKPIVPSLIGYWSGTITEFILCTNGTATSGNKYTYTARWSITGNATGGPLTLTGTDCDPVSMSAQSGASAALANTNCSDVVASGHTGKYTIYGGVFALAQPNDLDVTMGERVVYDNGVMCEGSNVGLLTRS